METTLQITLQMLMGVVTHLLISRSTRNPSSWQYLQSISRRWQIPAPSAASLLPSSPRVVLITDSVFPTRTAELAVKVCQMIHSTWQRGQACLLVWTVTFSHGLFLSAEPSMHANMIPPTPFHFLHRLLHSSVLSLIVLLGLTIYSMLDPQIQSFYCFLHFSIFCI